MLKHLRIEAEGRDYGEVVAMLDVVQDRVVRQEPSTFTFSHTAGAGISVVRSDGTLQVVPDDYEVLTNGGEVLERLGPGKYVGRRNVQFFPAADEEAVLREGWWRHDIEAISEAVELEVPAKELTAEGLGRFQELALSEYVSVASFAPVPSGWEVSVSYMIESRGGNTGLGGSKTLHGETFDDAVHAARAFVRALVQTERPDLDLPFA